MIMDEKQELLEIYKLHAGLADSVSRQRGTTNRFYLLLMSGIFVLFPAPLRFQNGVPLSVLMIAFGLLGTLLAVAWYIHIRSYRQLNSGKFKPLHELEEKLAYPFFKREWELLGEGEKPNKYWRLTVVETFVPAIFFVVFAIVLAIGIYLLLR